MFAVVTGNKEMFNAARVSASVDTAVVMVIGTNPFGVLTPLDMSLFLKVIQGKPPFAETPVSEIGKADIKSYLQ